jgi:hypothetical protein
MEALTNLKVKQRPQDNFFLGLLVKDTFAQRFLGPSANERKVLELRSRACRFLNRGDRICLLSIRPQEGRFILGILEYRQCITIPLGQMSRYRDLHRLSEQEAAEFEKDWEGRNGADSQVYGWEFQLVTSFDPPPRLEFVKCEVWCWFPSFLVRETTAGATKEEEQRLVGIARKSSACSLPEPSPKFRRMQSGNGSEGSKTIEDSQSPSVQESPLKQDVACTCLLVSATEWNALTGGVCDALLRPRSTTSSFGTDLYVLVQTSEGHRVSGTMCVGDAIQVSWGDESTKDLCQTVYSQKQVKSMKAAKEVWRWEIQEISMFDTPHMAKFVDVAPRHRHQIFTAKIQDLRPVPAAVPMRLDLTETAQYFSHLMKPADKIALQRTFKHLCKSRGGNGVIRVRTTCSGTDVCITVLKQTVEYLNKTEAASKPNSVSTFCFYIYAGILFWAACRHA